MRQNNFLTIASKVSLGVNNSNCLLKREARTTETPGPIKLFVRYLRICLVATHTQKKLFVILATLHSSLRQVRVCVTTSYEVRERERSFLYFVPLSAFGNTYFG